MPATLRLSFSPIPPSLSHDGACPSEPFFSRLNLTFPFSHGSFPTPLSCSPEVDRRRRYPLTMSTYDRPSNVLANQFEVTELNDESDFETLLSHDGRFSVCGFGSLLSERSARSTFPDLENFRIARLNGFRRVFAHVTPIFFERGIAKPETKEISGLSVEPCEGESLVVTVFEIKKSEIPAYIEREIEYRFLAVLPETLDGKPFDYPAVLCARYTDEEFIRMRCKGSKDMFYQLYGQYNIDKIWQDDILPCRAYLRHCVLAVKNLGNAAYDNFLDHTYLGDRKTTIRQYLAAKGSGIMEELPPESLKTRYGG
ncbi:hypothetical protein FNV43_RR00931 [Rhamnella rubrinervis]|uniref:Butirosin biosynthesis, BtrG-like protein n=1 Tax=Rhamnella rubrinervis TaxID=2594499 RepID=A0A8K0HPH1_9ROSA|nr:hypothetical protein FNV43_RR00931 [Rhamnella rubrinervis]